MRRYHFVPKIGEISQDELRVLRKSPQGSHIDLILKESLMDADYDREKMAKIISNKKDIWVISSFVDVVPGLKDSCKGDLVRSEFLFLRYLGDDTFDFSKKSDYVRYLEDNVFGALPHNVIYRLCDYNDTDFNFLDRRHETRGAARLLEQDELLQMDLEVVKSIQRTGRRVDVLVPHVTFYEEFIELRNRTRGVLGDVSVGTMLEVPSNLLEMEDFSDADFFVFGPGDLAKNLYGGIDRNSARFNRVNHDIIFPMVDSALNYLESLGKKKAVYLIKNLIGYDFGKHEHMDLVDMFMPSQLVTEARKK